MLVEVDRALKAALLEGRPREVAVLRMLKSALQLAAKDTDGQLSDSQSIDILRKQIKMRQDAETAYRQANSIDSAQQEAWEAEVLKEFLPPQLSENELEQAIDNFVDQQGIAFEKQNFGQIIGGISKQLEGRADKSVIAKILTAKLER